jgi:hypothetical protein
MNLQAVYGKGPLPLLWAGSRAATISGTLNLLNYCVSFVAYTQCTNVSAGRLIQPGGPRVWDPWSKAWCWRPSHLLFYFHPPPPTSCLWCQLTHGIPP